MEPRKPNPIFQKIPGRMHTMGGDPATSAPNTASGKHTPKTSDDERVPQRTGTSAILATMADPALFLRRKYAGEIYFGGSR